MVSPPFAIRLVIGDKGLYDFNSSPEFEFRHPIPLESMKPMSGEESLVGKQGTFASCHAVISAALPGDRPVNLPAVRWA